MAEHGEDGRAGGLRRFHGLEFELLAPGDDGTPDQLVHENDHQDHGEDAPENGARIAGIGGGLQVGSQAGKPQVALAQDEHLTRHQEKPSTGDAHHGIPDEPDCGIGKLQLGEALPPAEAVDQRRFVHLARDALHAGVDAEGHIPDLPGENQQDRAELHAHLARREQRHHGDHHTGQKAEHGDGLEGIQHGDEDPLRPAVMRGNPSVDERHDETDEVRDGEARQ